MDDERRRHQRQSIALPTRVTGRSVQSDIGMTLDLSASGVLVTARHRFKIGERVNVTFRTPQLDAQHSSSISGTVVRQRRVEEEGTLWPNEVAIRFDRLAPELIPLLSRPWRIEDRILLAENDPSF